MQPRWNTFEPGIAAEGESRRNLVDRIDHWWQAFGDTAADLDGAFRQGKEFPVADWMQRTLQAIDPNLMWEFGRGLERGHRLAITPEPRFDLRPLVDEILRRAPTLEGWSFYGHRLPESFEQARGVVEARTGASLEATGFECTRGHFGLIDVTVEFPRGFVRANRELAFSQAFVLLESLLGEEMLNAWIGGIRAATKRWRSSDLRDLAPTAAALKDERLAALPDRPLCETLGEESPWTLFELGPEAADDYPAQSDLFVGRSAHTEQWKNGHTDVAHFSERHSRAGEVFCYLKVDGSDGLEDSSFDDKGEIEDALDDALRPLGLGCVVGGGTGLRYSYVDLAVTDLSRATPVVREVLQAGRLTNRSWILFYDTELANEWIGLWPDSPPPPTAPRA